MSGYPPGGGLPPRARQGLPPQPGAFGGPIGGGAGLRPFPRRPPYDGPDPAGGVPGLGPPTYGAFHDPTRSGMPFLGRGDELEDYELLARQTRPPFGVGAPSQQGPPPQQRRGPQDWVHGGHDPGANVFLHHPGQQPRPQPSQQSSMWGVPQQQSNTTGSWPTSLIDAQGRGVDGGPPQLGGTNTGSFNSLGEPQHPQLAMHYLSNQRLPVGYGKNDARPGLASAFGGKKGEHGDEQKLLDDDSNSSSGATSQRTTSLLLPPTATSERPRGKLGTGGRDIENGDGTITREEFVEVYVLRPPSPIPRHVPPTIKDVTIMAPRPEQRSHILRAYPRERLAFTFPETALHDQKRLRSCRDSAVVRLKKNVLSRYVSYDAWMDRQPAPQQTWTPGGQSQQPPPQQPPAPQQLGAGNPFKHDEPPSLSSQPPKQLQPASILAPQPGLPPQSQAPSQQAPPPSTLAGALAAAERDHPSALHHGAGQAPWASGLGGPTDPHAHSAFQQPPQHHLPGLQPAPTHLRAPPSSLLSQQELQQQQQGSSAASGPPRELVQPPSASSTSVLGPSGGGGGGGVSLLDKIAAATAAADAELLAGVGVQQQHLLGKQKQAAPSGGLAPTMSSTRDSLPPSTAPASSSKPAPTHPSAAVAPPATSSGAAAGLPVPPPTASSGRGPQLKPNRKKPQTAPAPSRPAPISVKQQPPEDDDDEGSVALSDAMVEDRSEATTPETKAEAAAAHKPPSMMPLIPEGKPEERVMLLRDALLNGESVDLDEAARTLLVGVDMSPLTLKMVSRRTNFLNKHYREASRMFNMDGKSMPAPLSARRRAKEEAELEAEGFGSRDDDRDDDDDDEGHGGVRLAVASLPSPVPALSAAEEKWVQCDKCSKWRRLPPDVNVDKLPTRWYCSMNKRRPEVAYCDAPEEPYSEPTAVDPREIQDKRRIRNWLKRFDEDEKYTRSHQHQGAGDLVRRPIGVTDWIQCSNPLCGKWRALSKPTDGSLFTERVRRGMGVRTDQLWYCWMNTWDRDKASCASPQEGTLVPLRFSSRNRRVLPKPPTGLGRRGHSMKRPLPASSLPPSKRRGLPPPHNGRVMVNRTQPPAVRQVHPSRARTAGPRGYGGPARGMLSPPLPSGPPPGRRHYRDEVDDDEEMDAIHF